MAAPPRLSLAVCFPSVFFSFSPAFTLRSESAICSAEGIVVGMFFCCFFCFALSLLMRLCAAVNFFLMVDDVVEEGIAVEGDVSDAPGSVLRIGDAVPVKVMPE